ncbi:zinc ribbon domain-containing protein [Paenibacillus gorillae]|uniref:zinc ribbon domain-containing protein n=1 Tax=Paenibacillus gorillae TaxID=1243662 RepID=UPI0004B388F8|nr:zinc ribbon domain-containing protein [Paenibacillus gorillae]
MKSIKPGRGPSAMGAAGSIGSVIFGILWTIIAFSITRDAPFPLVGIIFPLFGVVFVITGIFQAVVHYKNATGKNRMSIVDIVDADEESDPLDRYYRKGSKEGRDSLASAAPDGIKKFCPYCGNRLASADYEYCPQCGKPL